MNETNKLYRRKAIFGNKSIIITLNFNNIHTHKKKEPFTEKKKKLFIGKAFPR